MSTRLAIIALALLLLPVVAGGSRATGAADSKLRALVDELRERRGELRQVMRNEREATRVLSQLDETLVRTRRELARLDRQLPKLEAEVASLRKQVAIDVSSVQELKDRLRSRLRALARVGGDGYLRVLLSASTPQQLAIRRVVLRRIAAHDAALLHELNRGKAQLLENRTALERRFLSLKASQEAGRLALQVLEETRLERSEALLDLGRQRGALEAQVDALRASESQLRRQIWSKIAATREPVGLAVLRGKLPWPAQGAVQQRVAEPGQKQAAFSKGWTIRAALGSRVRAIADGTVAHAGFLRGYGLLVILDHGHGYHTLCAHLARSTVEVGATVTKGEVIGFVGDSDSLDGVKLYFELRRGGRPVDPKRWLAPEAHKP